MREYTLAEHRARIANLSRAEHDAGRYTKRVRIRDYIPGQAIYNLGDYPARFSIEPTEYDEALLTEFERCGVGLIQVHEEWNDAARHLGADKFTSHDPEGMRHFVELCHRHHIRIIPYISSGYFHEYDPDFREAFGHVGMEPHWCEGMTFKYRCCAPESAEWRAYVLPRTFAALDTYGFDGIYNDWGYDWGPVRKEYMELRKSGGDVGTLYDPAIEDLLGLIYTEVKRRGGIYKLHADGNNRPPCRDRVYDYLWIGEGVGEMRVGVGKTYDPYVVPCRDLRHTRSAEDEFAAAIPFVQFPLLKRGRPLMGFHTEEDMPYYGSKSPESEYGYNKRVAAYMAEHPNGPYVYSLWSSIPDDPEEYPRWKEYLALYRPMVEENSLVFTELRGSPLFTAEPPEKVFASLFVNEAYYLAASNFTGTPYTLTLAEDWQDRRSGEIGRSFTIPHSSILFLKKTEEGIPC
ncbi:MAG: hypothetical protein GX929_08290 [Clostridiales bacterium]|jgi:hypothetical protein|nr:hypothetical protein [Clostridiales bacterium]